MQWSQFQQFKTVARLENITQAALELSVSQPALSRSMAKLEEELGFALFERGGKRIRLSVCGRMFLQHVERAMLEIEQGQEAVREYIDPEQGTVALAFLHSLGTNFVPSLVGRFRKLHPKVRFKLYQNGTAALVKQLLGGEIDLCLCAAVEEEGVEWTALFKEELFIAVPAAHPLAKCASIALCEIAEEPLITFKEHYGLRILSDALLRSANIAPEIKFEGEEIMTVAGLVEAGLGVAMIPHIHGLEQMKIVFLPIVEPVSFRTIGLAWQPGRYISPAVSQFKDFILQEERRRRRLV